MVKTTIMAMSYDGLENIELERLQAYLDGRQSGG